MSSSLDSSTHLPVKLIVCYARKDEGLRAKLGSHLTDLMQEGLVGDCHDCRFPAHEETEEALDARMDSAHIIMLLVGSDFLTSGACHDPVVQRAMERHHANEARVIPVCLCSVDWDSTPFHSLQILPQNGVPVTEWSDVDGAFADVARAIRETIQGFWPDKHQQTIPYSSPTFDMSVGSDDVGLPERIGRYRVERILNNGAFGRVFLARDPDLDRFVAIKTPHPSRISKPSDVEAYLDEARIVAQLDHSGLVPVYDVGRTEDGLCYVVSKMIGASDLQNRMKRARFPHDQSVQIVATVAEALDYAHQQDIVHRDVKPANILIDSDDHPVLADFGLALREEDFDQRSRYAGTPSYMSPEQARGEGHRVDGRSDVFSLGVVFYELLAGRKPFRGQNVADVLEKIANTDARPPRQIDATIPKELERICLRAIANRVLDRYPTAGELADDLRHYQAEATRRKTRASGEGGSDNDPSDVVSSDLGSLVDQSSSSTRRPPAVKPLRIIPKGLRPFDFNDRDFFLELLPGPRDRDGLPESIRFWKTRIEETEANEVFTVGLIYGPSGCGKSSFVRAGLIPRLAADRVVPLYIESASGQTETRLRNGLRRHCPDLPTDTSLSKSLALVRQGLGLPPGKKLLIILDQFEHWIHATREEDRTTLLDAIRQSDGERVQCIMMVRADFWMAANRCMRRLDVYPREGENSSAVDLFDLPHARKVLADFGRSFSVLPENATQTTREQERFLDEAVLGLAENEKIIPVRLALFAYMIRGRPWTVKTLKEIGGMEGVGARFLEETFTAATASPEHRLHERAARGVLRALLPGEGTDLRICVRTDAELRVAAGYSNRPDSFSELLRILDKELRLITPTERETVEVAETDAAPAVPDERQFQLTHDYLVPAVREWLTRRQKETVRGRAELRLEERAALWSVKLENRQLPTIGEFLRIRWLTRTHEWTESQRKMMRVADRYHVIRACIAVLMLSIGVIGYREIKNRQDANYSRGLVNRLLDADITLVSGITTELDDYRKWTDTYLRETLDDPASDPERRLRAGLGVLSVDESVVDDLCERLLTGDPAEVRVIRNFLDDHRDDLVQRLWEALGGPAPASRSLRAACALAEYDLASANWNKDTYVKAVVGQLVSEPLSEFGEWMSLLSSAKEHLVEPLSRIFRDADRTETERSVAAAVLAEYTKDQPTKLAELIVDANVKKHYDVFFTNLKPHDKTAVTLLESKLDETSPPDAADEVIDKLALQQANAAVALLRMDRGVKVWPLLEHRPDPRDPRLRTYVIHRLAPLDVNPKLIVDRLLSLNDTAANPQNDTVRSGLILALGGYPQDRFGTSDLVPRFAELLTKLRDWYRRDRNPGIHGATEWLLKKWGMEPEVAEMAKGLTENETALRNRPPSDGRRWYVNTQGQTVVVIPGPVDFTMGSPPSEIGREGGSNDDFEHQHRVIIERSFGISAHEVTVAQFRQLQPEYEWNKDGAPDSDCPVNRVTWYQAAEYCNALSKEEGIPKGQWCYEPNAQGLFADGMRPVPGYIYRVGYRLPTEAEWAYACRAGTVTSRYYGQTEDLLGKYAWYKDDSSGLKSWRVGMLMPNDLGLFDMLGNVIEWCHDQQREFADSDTVTPTRDLGEDIVVNDEHRRALRGGGFLYQAMNVRSAQRDKATGDYVDPVIGFRVARTYNPPLEQTPQSMISTKHARNSPWNRLSRPSRSTRLGHRGEVFTMNMSGKPR